MTEAQIAAIAGEHYVAHKIAMLGFIPTLVRQRMPRTDLLVTSAAGDKTVTVQIRSAANATREVAAPDAPGTFFLRFPLGHRAITGSTENTFFCFVDLRRMSPSAVPDVYVMSAPTLKAEYERVYRRRYSQLHYERPWREMQPFRNNWEPIEKALTETTPVTPAFQLHTFAQRLRDELVLIGSRQAAAG
jgi:hypothetical protein